jgi:hypothetical protein
MNGGWEWHSPEPKMLKSPEDAQAETMSTFGPAERLRAQDAPSELQVEAMK